MTRSKSYPRLPSTCPHDCPSTCALEVERIDDQTIGRVYGAKANPYTAGVLCAKVGRYAERVHHPDRLRTPLRRIGDKGVGRSAFQTISWDAALDEIAEQFIQRALRYSAESIWPYFYAGTMGLVQRDGIERLRHVMGYSRQHSTICNTLSDAGWLAGVGVKRGIDPREMQNADLIIVWGGNPVHTQVNVMHHIALARRQRGAKLVVVDPYRTATAEKADLHLMLRPGTDAALCCAVMNILLAEDYADHDYMARYTDVPDQLTEHLAGKTPAWAADITGLSVDQIESFARLYGKTQRSFIRIGYGFSRSRNGAANLHAVSCLPAITGAWQYPGGGALYSNGGLYHIDYTMIKGLDRLDQSIRLLDQCQIGPILCNDAAALAGGAPVSALFIQNTNPMVVTPASEQVREGFDRSDLFIAVHEQFLTETAQMADIVLPATTFLEHDDLYVAGGHTFLQVAKPVIEPFADCRSNHEVLCALAKRLGAEHPGFELTAAELIDATLARSAYPDAEQIYQQQGYDCALDWEQMHFLQGFGHQDGRFHFRPDWTAIGTDSECMPILPDHMTIIDQASAECPFRLVAAPARHFLNTSFTETPTSRRYEQQPTVKIHPEDCQQLGLATGSLARLGNKQGSVVVTVEAFTGLQRGVVVVESIWDNSAFAEGRGINTLVSPDPGPPNGGGVFHDTAIWISAV